jgi:hypothetical protein
MRIPASAGPPEYLNRFTTMPILLDVLHQKHLVLLDPETWEDRNDAYFMKRYKEEQKLKSVLALCFSTCRETFHHWKVFSAGTSGVCIEFDAKSLISAFQKAGIQSKRVRYQTIKDVESTRPSSNEWPFLKRLAYKDEQEFRAVYHSKADEMVSKEVSIKLSWIIRITLSPWLPKPVADSAIGVIKAIPGCDTLKITRSSLLENSRWKGAITPNLKA